MAHKSIAIDGPSGAGKSTLARHVARELGFLYVDTGAIYRTVALQAKRAGLTPTDTQALAALLDKTDIQLRYDADGTQRMLLDGEDVSTDIRAHEISALTSKLSSLAQVRSFLLDLQQQFAAQHDVVMDGRDIGTVVLPRADVKIFLTASPQMRAKRRQLELAQRGEQVDFDILLQDMRARDAQDENRAIAPLRQAQDAVVLDTTQLTFAQSAQAILRLVKERMAN